MTGLRLNSFGRATLLGGAAWCALTLAASASILPSTPNTPAAGDATPDAASADDLPATPEGAAKLTELFKTYFGSDPAQSGLSVTPEDDDYLVTFDLGALAAPLAKSGVKIDAAKITMKLFAQEDGAWRVERGDMPTIVWHDQMNKIATDHAMAFTGFDSSIVYDPKIGGPRSGEFSADKLSVATHQPNVDQNFDIAGLKGSTTGKAGPDDSYTASLHETLDAIGFAVAADPKVAEPKSITEAKPTMVVGKTGPSVIDANLDGWKTKPLLALKAFAVAHPTNADLQASAGDFKALLAAVAGSQPSVAETFAVETISADLPQGKLSIGKASGNFGVSASGATSHFEERIAVTGLQLPETMAPAMFRDFIPTGFDIGVKVSGFDINAAAQEAVSDMVVGDDGPKLSKEDHDKVTAKLLGAGPLLIDIPPSTLVAPMINVAFQGRIQYRPGGKPTGTITIHMRDFDKTVSALKGLGPDAEQKYVPVMAMAKGLAQTDSDGALSWIGEIGPDGIMKVNGLPLGKAPF